MISKNVKVEVALREEDRPIAFLVQMASQFESKILFETGNKQVNVKSMMGMMSLGLDLDRLEDLTVVADGADEEEAVSKIEGYLTKGAQIQHICAFIYAEIAQLVEHFTRNEGVAGSSPVFGLHNKGSGKRLILCLVLINYQNKKNAYNLCGIPTIHD